MKSSAFAGLRVAAVLMAVQPPAFHFSMSPAVPDQPDAKQVPATGHETLLSPDSRRAGSLRRRHLLPFQLAANCSVFLRRTEVPTAMHETVLGQETAL